MTTTHARNPRTRMGLGGLGRVLVLRLAPGEDVLPSMEQALRDTGISQAVILSGVASLRHASLRNIHTFPEEWPIRVEDRHRVTIEGPLEILAMQGNVAPDPDGGLFIHCHIDFSTGNPPATTYGGHLLEDTIVGTTCEIYIAEVTGLEMRRVQDDETRTLEIDVTPRFEPR